MAGRHRFTGGPDRATVGRGTPAGGEIGGAAARTDFRPGQVRGSRAGGTRFGVRRPDPARRLVPARIEVAARP